MPATDMLAWENSGFSVDASVRITLIDRDVPSYFQSLEHLLQYCPRPPFAMERGNREHRQASPHGGDGHGTTGCCDANQKPRSQDTSRIAWAKLIARMGWGSSFRSSAPVAAATSGAEWTAGRSRLTSNRKFASGRRPGWFRPREVSHSHTSANHADQFYRESAASLC